MTKEQVIDAALELSPEDRVEVAQLLLGSIDEGEDELDGATMREIARRCAEIDAGTAEMMTLDELDAYLDARCPGTKP